MLMPGLVIEEHREGWAEFLDRLAVLVAQRQLG